MQTTSKWIKKLLPSRVKVNSLNLWKNAETIARIMENTTPFASISLLLLLFRWVHSFFLSLKCLLNCL